MLPNLGRNALSCLCNCYLTLNNFFKRKIAKNSLFVALTIDTESDVDAKQNHIPEYRNIKKLKILISILKKHNITSTFFVTPDIVNNCNNMISELYSKDFEIGTHIHPDLIGSFSQQLADLSYTVQKKLIRNATSLITKEFCKPTSFRAGRYSANQDTFKILDELGYKIDSSVTPYTSWIKDGGQDWRNYSAYLTKFPSTDIIEVPITIFPFPIKNQWYRPTFSNSSLMNNIIEYYSSKSNTLFVANILIHSYELLESNPYNISPDILLKRLDKSIVFAKNLGAEFINLKQVREFGDNL
jgi:peptidoglycan/xylan/chitin deacetylase (PgdA/CDA1 family)